MRQVNELFKSVLILAVLIMFVKPGLCVAGNLLCDAGFEQSEPNGGFPDSGCWQKNAGGQAGCALFAARNGDSGIFQYTGYALNELKSQVYQEFPSAAGRRYFASTWVRTDLSNSVWLAGSKALLKVEFLDKDGYTLADYNSIDITQSETSWVELQVATNAAPTGTYSTRYSLIVEKPQTIGQTVAGFDDCIFREYEGADCISLNEAPPCPGEIGQKLNGSVIGINPDDYMVGVYVFTGTWQPKPTFAQPWTTIDANGTWQCNIATSSDDLNATKVMAFLVPKNEIADWPVDFSNQTGLSALPLDAFRFPSTGSFRPSCFAKTLQFAGYDWLVEDSDSQSVGPGPNIFDANNAWVDADGKLHLKITNTGSEWKCAEVFTKDSLGGGKYNFAVESNASSMNPNVVLSMFTRDEFAPQYANREMDIDISRWGSLNADNAQYVIQPEDKSGNLHKFDIASQDKPVTHILDWRFGVAGFESFYGLGQPADQSSIIDSWTYTGSNVPMPGTEKVRINLWLNGGTPPSDGCEVEVVIRDFAVSVCSYEITPTTLDFNSALVGATATKPITIANTGNCIPYTVNIDVTGDDANYFQAADRAFSIEPGSSKQLNVAFTPDSVRAYNAVLEIKGHTGIISVPLTGKGGQIGYTHIGAIGSPDYLEGRVAGLDFSDYRVVSYIYIFDQWYLKPTCIATGSSTKPLVKINKDGTWECDIDAQPTDKAATQVASFILPKNADTPPCTIDSPDDSRLSQYTGITAEKPKFSISSITASKGTNSGNDSIIVNGWYYITISEALSAQQLRLSIGQQDKTIWTLTVPFNADKFLSNESFQYNKSGVGIQMTNQNQILNSYTGNLRLTVNNADLTCLFNPITVAMEAGDFKESAVADESLNENIINGKQNIGIKFLSGCTNAIKITKHTLKKNNMTLNGVITFKNAGPDLASEDVVIGWNNQTFTIPAGSFAKISKKQPKYKCKKIKTAQGGIIDAYFDFKAGTFAIKIKGTKLDSSTNNTAFNIAMSDFSEGVMVKTNN